MLSGRARDGDVRLTLEHRVDAGALAIARSLLARPATARRASSGALLAAALLCASGGGAAAAAVIYGWSGPDGSEPPPASVRLPAPAR